MAFVDILTSQLFALGFAGLVVAYVFVECYLRFRSGKRISDGLKSGAIPVAALGAYLFVTSIFDQFVWPLPGSYNILFYDLLSLAGVLMIAFAWAVRRDDGTHAIGFFGLMLGLVTIYYGYEGYLLNLTSSPVVLLGLYGLFGIAGVFSYPATLVSDLMLSGAKRVDTKWIVLSAIFVIALVLGSLLAIGAAALAVPAHLASPP